VATTEEILKELSLPKGYMSPLGKEGISVILDSAIDINAGYVVGANKIDFHTKGFTPSRDIKEFKQADIRLTKTTDFAPDGKTPIQFRKGIEAGQIFQLGSKYTKSMGATVLDQKGKKVNPMMGCYGIGISRTLAAAVEQHHDEDGIIWPATIAPFDIYFAVIGKKDSTKQFSHELYSDLKANGFDVLLDDRGMGPGGMFKDADLLGLPIRLLLGERDFEASGELEIKIRRTGEVIKVSKENLTSKLKEVLSSLGKNI
jgi:prolyl-tRNA synthetase